MDVCPLIRLEPGERQPLISLKALKMWFVCFFHFVWRPRTVNSIGTKTFYIVSCLMPSYFKWQVFIRVGCEFGKTMRCFLAMLYTHSKWIEEWTIFQDKKNDEIVRHEDYTLYLDAFKSGSLSTSDAQTISLNNLPVESCWPIVSNTRNLPV